MLNYHSRKRRGISQLELIQGLLVTVVIVHLFGSNARARTLRGTSKLSQLSQLSLAAGLDRFQATSFSTFAHPGVGLRKGLKWPKFGYRGEGR